MSTIKYIDRRCGRLRCAVARYVSEHVNVSGAYRHVPRNSATQATNVAYKEPYVVECMLRNDPNLSTSVILTCIDITGQFLVSKYECFRQIVLLCATVIPISNSILRRFLIPEK